MARPDPFDPRIPEPTPGGTGLRPVLETGDFDQWEAFTRQALGEHHSWLESGASGFRCRCRAGQAGELSLLHLAGQGRMQLDRRQGPQGVLWLPLRGVNRERINGVELEVQPGEALICRPGDELRGTTADSGEGVSILLPARLFAPAGEQRGWPHPPLLLQRRVPQQAAWIEAARELVRATAWDDPARHHQAQALLAALAAGLEGEGSGAVALPAARRLELIRRANRWMERHLGEPFGIEQLAAALETPPRTLQRAFQQELGCAPLEQARRLRLAALRRRLEAAEPAAGRVLTLMAELGLPASGATAERYRQCYGELPRQTLQRSPSAGRRILVV